MPDPVPPAPPETEAQRDLGFGSFVARVSQSRLLNPNGTFNVRRRGLQRWSSRTIYHHLLTISWTKFFALFLTAYFTLNVLFAAFYLACGPGALKGETPYPRGLEAFFFSVQTFATIGYGTIAPAGIAANVIVAIEAVAGLLTFAFATALLFARFSRPTAEIVYSRQALIAPYRNRTSFQFRIVNARNSEILDLGARVIFSRFEGTAPERLRRFYPLPLERDAVAFFPLSWTIVHPIDERSPLHGMTAEAFNASQAEFLILLRGTDETFSETVHSRRSYIASEVVWNARFRPVFLPLQDEDLVAIDIGRLHEIEPVADSTPALPK